MIQVPVDLFHSLRTTWIVLPRTAEQSIEVQVRLFCPSTVESRYLGTGDWYFHSTLESSLEAIQDSASARLGKGQSRGFSPEPPPVGTGIADKSPKV